MREFMKRIYKGKFIDVRTKNIRFPDGHTSLYEMVLHDPAVAMVPVLDRNHILLIRQYRPVVKKKIARIKTLIREYELSGSQ